MPTQITTISELTDDSDEPREESLASAEAQPNTDYEPDAEEDEEECGTDCEPDAEEDEEESDAEESDDDDECDPKPWGGGGHD